jgi:hypothetical protein
MTQRHSIWRDIGRNIRNSSRRSNGGQRNSGAQLSRHSQRSNSKGFWSSASDIVFFKPSKDPMLPVWKDMYKLNRQIGDLERSLSQPALAAGSGIGSWVIRKLFDTWGEIVVEAKAMGTALGFHFLQLFLIILFNVIWFTLLFWLMGLWLGG